MNDKQVHYYSVTMFSVISYIISYLEFQVLDITFCVSSVDDEADLVTLKWLHKFFNAYFITIKYAVYIFKICMLYDCPSNTGLVCTTTKL